MPRTICAALVALVLAPFFAQPHAQARQASAPYFPPAHQWATRMPGQVGLDAAALNDAIQFSIAHENQTFRDLLLYAAITRTNEPFNTPIGPTTVRGPVSGLIVRNGYLVAEWGEPARVDMTFSVTKTFLTTWWGWRGRKGSSATLSDRARGYMPHGVDLFDAPHNQPITWDHLLRQTSDWQGTLWGKPDWADRPEGDSSTWPNRKLYEPGTHYKYNDVRVNVMALALLHVASASPSRGAARGNHGADWRLVHLALARLRELVRRARRPPGAVGCGRRSLGRRHAHQRVRHGALRLSVSPQRQVEGSDSSSQSSGSNRRARPAPRTLNTATRTGILNTARKPLARNARVERHFSGDGPNIIYIDWENDLVVVVRWMRNHALNEFLGKVIGALRARPTA